MIHSLNREQAGAELYQAQFKLGLAKQALPNKNLSYVIIKKIVWLRLANMLRRPAISLKLLDISLQQKGLDQAVYIVQLFALNFTTTWRQPGHIFLKPSQGMAFHSGRHGMCHSILAGMKHFTLAGMEWHIPFWPAWGISFRVEWALKVLPLNLFRPPRRLVFCITICLPCIQAKAEQCNIFGKSKFWLSMNVICWPKL